MKYINAIKDMDIIVLSLFISSLDNPAIIFHWTTGHMLVICCQQIGPLLILFQVIEKPCKLYVFWHNPAITSITTVVFFLLTKSIAGGDVRNCAHPPGVRYL